MIINEANISRMVRSVVDGLRKTKHMYHDLTHNITASKTTNSVYIRFTIPLYDGDVIHHSIRVSDHPNNTDKDMPGKVVIMHRSTSPNKLKRSIMNTIERLYETRKSESLKRAGLL